MNLNESERLNRGQEIYVPDSFALLAYLGGEKEGGSVKAILAEVARGDRRALPSPINLGEVAYIARRACGLKKAWEVLAVIEQLPIEILPVDGLDGGICRGGRWSTKR